jgi:hypothetical protein
MKYDYTQRTSVKMRKTKGSFWVRGAIPAYSAATQS